MRCAALACLLLTPLPVLAKDFDFKEAVEDMEDHLGTQRTRIPMWGIMRFVGYPVYRPMGVKNFDMAIFQKTRGWRNEQPPIFERLGAGWRPMLRVKHRERDSVFIYARDEGSWVRMVMLTSSGGDAVLMQFKMRPSRLMLFLSQQARR